MSFEEVVRLQPDYIVFASEHRTRGHDARGFAGAAGGRIYAVETGHVVNVSDEVDGLRRA